MNILTKCPQKQHHNKQILAFGQKGRTCYTSQARTNASWEISRLVTHRTKAIQKPNAHRQKQNLPVLLKKKGKDNRICSYIFISTGFDNSKEYAVIYCISFLGGQNLKFYKYNHDREQDVRFNVH